MSYKTSLVATLPHPSPWCRAVDLCSILFFVVVSGWLLMVDWGWLLIIVTHDILSVNGRAFLFSIRFHWLLSTFFLSLYIRTFVVLAVLTVTASRSVRTWWKRRESEKLTPGGRGLALRRREERARGEGGVTFLECEGEGREWRRELDTQHQVGSGKQVNLASRE